MPAPGEHTYRAFRGGQAHPRTAIDADNVGVVLERQVEEWEQRARRRDIMVDEQALFDFYAERVPASVVSVRHFDRWWSRAVRETPELLDLSLERLTTGATGVSEARYPSFWSTSTPGSGDDGGQRLALRYEFEPGSTTDGVSVDVPLAQLNQVDEDSFGWQIPAHRVAPAWEAIQNAQAAAPSVSPREQAYIAALATRYAPQPPADRTALDSAFAGAMREVARQHPDDLDASALFAEALMDVTPWSYYAKDGSPPRPETGEVVSTLESVLRRDPKHAWATHLYIHATEASTDPGRAAAYADTLGDLVPGAGHLVHMPAHTDMRIGRYHDAVLVNERASAADWSYLEQCQAQGTSYAAGYVPHNSHFRYAAAAMAGNSAAALSGAGDTASGVEHHPGHRAAGAVSTSDQHAIAQPLFAYVRFTRWQQILDTPAPPEDQRYRTAIWHYALGRALVGTGRPDAAEAELAAFALDRRRRLTGHQHGHLQPGSRRAGGRRGGAGR